MKLEDFENEEVDIVLSLKQINDIVNIFNFTITAARIVKHKEIQSGNIQAAAKMAKYEDDCNTIADILTKSIAVNGLSGNDDVH